MPNKRGRHVTSLDGLRALCALGVVGYHMNLNWCQGGLIGVTVFFVLSGYLVTSGLLNEFVRNRGIDLKRFWVKRLKRIMPTAIAFVVVVAATMTFANHLLLTKMRLDIVPALLMVLNWFKIFTNESYFAAAGAPSPLTHFWYLSIDMQFYLIWPPILLLLLKKRVKKRFVMIGLIVATVVSAVLMALLYTPGQDPSRSYYGTDTRAMSLLLGCWLAFAWPFKRKSMQAPGTEQGPSRALMEAFGFGGVALLVLMMLFTEGYSSFSYYGGVLLCSLISVVAIAGLVVPGTVVSKVLSLPPIAWLGERSFALYIWHYPVIELLQPRNATALPWWIYLVELAISIVLAELSYRFIEMPFREKGTGLPKARQGGPQHEAAGGGAPAKGMVGAWLKSHVPATAITCIVTAIAVVGLVAVPPVAVGGGAVDEKKVMMASLKKPLVDGVYDVVFIGDSVSLGVNEELNEAFPHGLVDTEGGRQFHEGIDMLQANLDQGVVGDTVIFSLGTNGDVLPEDLETIMGMCGDKRTVWFVNVRSPYTSCEVKNQIIEECVDAHDNARLIDWYGASYGHDDWLTDDGMHLTYDGREAYAGLVVESIGYVAPSDENTKYDVTFIGDIVALKAADQLAALFPHGVVDCADVRTVESVAAAYAGYADKGVVGSDVVFCLGNEEMLGQAEVENLVAKVGPDKNVWLVNDRTPEPWCNANNEVLDVVAAAHENVSVIDWHAASQGHDEYLAEDGLTLSEAGAAAYAQTLKAAMGR